MFYLPLYEEFKDKPILRSFHNISLTLHSVFYSVDKLRRYLKDGS